MLVRPSSHALSGISPELPRNGVLLCGRYRIGEQLGRGGMGVVLRARDTLLDRDVALKLMLPELARDAEALERFSTEAHTLAKLQSRHIVRVLDIGSVEPRENGSATSGLPFMVLELLAGRDLYSELSFLGPLSVERTVDAALQACAGLAEAHAHGIVHRDLKPENLFMAREPDGTECLKLLDFGIAYSGVRSAQRAETQRGGIGSPGYMAPEQLTRTGHVDARSDIWGLGVVMYELLSGHAAFGGETAQAVQARILTGAPKPLGSLRRDVPRGLVRIIERCLERDPDQRFQDVAELAQHLAPYRATPDLSLAEGVRRRLDLSRITHDDLGRTTPTPEPGPRRHGRLRRALSLLLFAAIFAPALAVLEQAAEHSERLAPTRAWVKGALTGARDRWCQATQLCGDFRAAPPSSEPKSPP